MIRVALWVPCLALLFLASSAFAGEIEFVEDFALAKDRAEPLKQLVAGTEEFYYYHCLHLQNTEQFDKVDALLKTWIERHGYTARVHEIQNRQALLTYAKNPKKSLEFVRQKLGIEFNHQRELLDEKPNLPTTLDPQAIARETLQRQALDQFTNLQGFEYTALEWLAALPLDPDRRRNLLERLQFPDIANLPKLVVDDLNHEHSQGFGAFSIHRQLLLTQLDELLKLKPELLNESNFVNTYLHKLQPNADVDWRRDPVAQAAHLDRLAGFVSRLAPVHNALKAHVAYHRLALEHSRGVYDKERLLAYLKTPRRASYVNEKFLEREENRSFVAGLEADFSGVTLLPPVGNDEPLVRDHLLHFFVNETTFKPYEPYINDLYLKRTFAEAKIVNGLGEPEQWYSLLPPAEYQALKQRVDLDFVPNSKKTFAVDEPVRLDVDIKNVSTLLVKVFEINTSNFYRQNLREIDTDINLDGLIANEESTHKYAEPPLRRVRRHFEFPTLTKPGVYVIDFIGNGKSSRALIRKGKLHYTVRTSTAGQIFSVLDERHTKLNGTAIWLAGHEYQADKDGAITVPFSHAPGEQPLVMTHGEFASLDRFQHEAENYSLAAGLYVDRESLLQRKTAQVIVRPGLLLNGSPVTLSVLEDVRLVISSTDHDGVATSKDVPNFKLFEDRESVFDFEVPARLSQISFSLKAKVQSLSQNKRVDLQADQTFTLNQIDKTEKVEGLHLSLVSGQYLLSLLGKTGEPKPDRPVQISLKHRDITQPAQVTLQTDRTGRIVLGPLVEITRLGVTGPEGTQDSWWLTQGHDAHTYPRTIHGKAGETVELPYFGTGMNVPTRNDVSLLELRGDVFTADRIDSLTIRDGMLYLSEKLPRGDYDLHLKSTGQRIRIRLAEGERRGSHVHGENRQLEVRAAKRLQIERIETTNDAVKIHLRNAQPKFARVHIFATRFVPAYSAFGHLASVRAPEPFWRGVPKLDSAYVAGRDIGDEYRYILDRKYAKKFPGNSLDRPSLLLNPWLVRATETGEQLAQAGVEFEAAGLAPASPPPVNDPHGGKSSLMAQIQGFANLDFLSQPTAVLLNLTADENGLVTIPRGKLGAHQHLHVVAVDPRSTTYRSISLPQPAMDSLDLRLANGLDPKLHFSQQKQISIVEKGKSLVLADVGSSRMETYDSLARVYSLYATLSHDPKLAEFAFLLNWPKLKPEEQGEKYSKYACHELNFFLFKRDPEFFRTVVQPYLRNKKDKTFLDRWLVHDDVSAHLRPWSHGRLNIVERILLGQRIAGELQHTSRHVDDLFALLPPDANRFTFLFETALKGRALEKGMEIEGLVDLITRTIAPQAWGDANANGALAGNLSLRIEQTQSFANGLASPRAEAPADAPAESKHQLGALAEHLSANTEAQRLHARSGRIRYRSQDGVARDADDTKESLWMDTYEALRQSVRQLYVKLDATQEWAENNYFQLPIDQQGSGLITVNAFWRDYARHDPAGKTPFLSGNFAEASHNFSEMMFALALLDLPFEAGKHESKLDAAAGKLTLTAGSPLIVFHEEVKPSQLAAEQTPVLVSQNFFRHGDRYRQENNEQVDKFVAAEFLVQTAYGCQIVVTNPTSSRQRVEVLLQVPIGALPLLGARYTRSVPVDLEPYRTQTLEYTFYFPLAGRFAHYPVHVSKGERLLAATPPCTFNVVNKFSQIDRESWAYVSQHGSSDDVLKYLRDNNLERTDLQKIAFRMGDKKFFEAVVGLLAERHVFNNVLWSYALQHDVPEHVREYLKHADEFVAECGGYLRSPLLDIDPVARHAYEHLDYRPLVNARAHQLGQRRQILNERFHEQYHRLLTQLSYKRDLADDDLLAVTYYLLLQDRIEEALGFFRRVNAEQLASRLQYDYFAAHLDFYSDQPKQAPALAAKHSKHPVDRWQKSFAAISSQLDEIAAKSDLKVVDVENRDQTQSKLAATEASFEFRVETKKITLDYQKLAEVRVHYYPMDIELLFSSNPFVQQVSGQFAFIRPNFSQQLKLPPGQTTFTFDLPERYHSGNVLVEITGSGETKSQAYYSNALALQVLENYGQVRVAAAPRAPAAAVPVGTSGAPNADAVPESGRSLSKVYVKVYAQMQDGTTRFYKDGYTDLRGHFDYASLNTNELEHVAKFSLLLMSDEHGAVVREAKPPKR